LASKETAMADATVEIDEDLCDNNQCCEAVCPEDVFEIRNNRVYIVRPDSCILCFKCVEACPAGAISVDY